jgi:hypothetical protein
VHYFRITWLIIFGGMVGGSGGGDISTVDMGVKSRTHIRKREKIGLNRSLIHLQPFAPPFYLQFLNSLAKKTNHK